MKSVKMKYLAVLLPITMMFCATAGAQEHEKHEGEHKKAAEHVHKKRDETGNPKNQAINHMHHQLDEDQAAYKAREAQAQQELNEMTIRDDVRLEDVFGKIDELMAAKNQIMRLRYEHLIEMRKLLTEEERVKYDANVLKRSEVR